MMTMGFLFCLLTIMCIRAAVVEQKALVNSSKVDPEEVREEEKRIAVTAVAGAVVAGVQTVKTLLNTVLHNSDSPRKVAIGLANTGSKALVKPTWYIKWGIVRNNLPQRIDPETTGLIEFENNPKGLAHGTSGVLTYTIEGTDYIVALMWSVPYSYILYHNWFNFKVYNTKDIKRADEKLWAQMYKYSNAFNAKNGGYRTRNEYDIRVHGSMTNSGESQFDVYVATAEPNESGNVHLHSGCSVNPKWFSHYCWRECSSSGWCWVNTSCNSKGQEKLCTRQLPCYSDCD